MSLAVYIPAPELSEEAAVCRERVLAYLARTLQLLEPPGRAADDKHRPHLSLQVALLHANHLSPTIHCDLSESSTGLEQGWRNETRWAEQFEGTAYIDVYDAEYPVGALRQLALDMVRSAYLCMRNLPSCGLDVYRAVLPLLCSLARVWPATDKPDTAD